MRLIDADAFEVYTGKVPQQYDADSYLAGNKEVLEAIDAAPTVVDRWTPVAGLSEYELPERYETVLATVRVWDKDDSCYPSVSLCYRKGKNWWIDCFTGKVADIVAFIKIPRVYRW